MSQPQTPGNTKVVTPSNIGKILEKWLRKIDEPGRVFTKNKKIEIVFLIEAVNAILSRTEGVEDITLVKIPGTDYEVPAILPEKPQAVARRNMLSYLRDYYSRNRNEVRGYLEKLSKVFVPIEDESKKEKKKKEKQPVGYVKAGEYLEKGEWNCYIQPPSGEGTDEGMDGFCPACALFGSLLDKTKISVDTDISVGLKSRVEFDPAFAISDRKVSVVPLTHIKVGDGLSWTGQSLFREFHVVPGTVFVGKVTLEDVTEPELTAFLATLATISRLGGRERIFGGVRIHIVGIKGGSYETVSALELAKKLVKKYAERLPDVEEVIRELKQELSNRGFITEVDQEEVKKLVDSDSTWRNLWISTLEYSKQVLERVLQLLGIRDKYQLVWKE